MAHDPPNDPDFAAVTWVTGRSGTPIPFATEFADGMTGAGAVRAFLLQKYTEAFGAAVDRQFAHPDADDDPGDCDDPVVVDRPEARP